MIAFQTLQKELEDKLKGDLPALESLRKKVMTKVLLNIGLRGLILLSAVLFLTIKILQLIDNEIRTTNDGEFIWALIGSIFFLFTLSGIYANKMRQKITRKYLYEGEYAERYREEVVEKVLPAMIDGISFTSEKGISETEFGASGFPLFQNPARYYSSGKMNGIVGKTTFEFAEVWAEGYSRQDEGQGQYMDLFRGVFFVIDFQKETKWNTLVYPDAIKYFSPFLLGKFSEEKYFSSKNFQRIKLEDVEFERYFEVYGTDQIESRYVLSPAVMSRIIAFKKNSKRKFQLSFKSSKVYFGVYYPIGKGMFSAPLFAPVYSLRKVENFAADVRMLMEFIKELNLNSNLV